METRSSRQRADPRAVHIDSSGPVPICKRCKQSTGHQSLMLWCLQCRRSHRRRGQARGLIKSIRTRRLKAWLKTLS